MLDACVACGFIHGQRLAGRCCARGRALSDEEDRSDQIWLYKPGRSGQYPRAFE
jgi:hypothetical protein